MASGITQPTYTRASGSAGCKVYREGFKVFVPSPGLLRLCRICHENHVSAVRSPLHTVLPEPPQMMNLLHRLMEGQTAPFLALFMRNHRSSKNPTKTAERGSKVLACVHLSCLVGHGSVDPSNLPLFPSLTPKPTPPFPAKP